MFFPLELFQNFMQLNRIILTTIFLLSFGSTLVATSATKKDNSQDFIVLTIPKSGTHLLVKLLVMLTERKPDVIPSGLEHVDLLPVEFENQLLEHKVNKKFFYAHTGPHGALCNAFLRVHPNFLTILNIRDLRDLLVSYVYHMSARLAKEIEKPTNFEEKLTRVLNPNLSRLGRSIERNIIIGIEWSKRPNVLITRFEDLVGAPGGGDANKQAQAIISLAKHTGVTLNAEKLKQIQFNLFGNTKKPHFSGTFRKGQIGSWKDHFTQEHIELFKTYWGSYQLELGYPLDF